MRTTDTPLPLLLPLGLFVLLFLDGCGSAVIMMQDPKTGQVFRCERNALAPLADYNASENCAQALERAGWKRL